ncbi:MAG TPA: L-threonylcarbamoyladenylate synthase [Gammaproteobacteria bacterium]|jgi:L-threonylcarbamoyladenylate synthase|nr:L-threonylcarbamoyladenylate synthase [Gammaproteobacteria bacterium]
MVLQEEINRAAAILHDGGLVAVPTETVYGLAADARNPQAAARVFAAKERPHSHPLIVHLTDFSQAAEWAREIPAEARQLAEVFWPGPLTLILKKRPEVLDIVTGGQDTVALRAPRHPVAQALLQAFGGGLVAPSANRFTRISPTTAAAVQSELGDRVDMILDGGACEVGLESTILDLSSGQLRILRPGMISPQQIAAVIGRDVQVMRQDFPAEVRAPGMHHLHYAPETRTELISAARLQILTAAELPAVYLYHHEIPSELHAQVTAVKMPANAAAYAHELYAVLRAQDQQQFQRIFIETVPDAPEWDAIRDRLIKACGKF